MPRLEFEGAMKIDHAFGVVFSNVVKRRTLVPGFGKIGPGSQKHRKARFGNVVTLRSDVAHRTIQRLGGTAMRMVHPHGPDGVLDRGCFAFAVRKPVKEHIQAGRKPVARTTIRESGNEAKHVGVHMWTLRQFRLPGKPGGSLTVDDAA